MAQEFFDPKINETFSKIFRAESEEKLNELMKSSKALEQKKGNILTSEVMAETLEELREEMRKNFKIF